MWGQYIALHSMGQTYWGVRGYHREKQMREKAVMDTSGHSIFTSEIDRFLEVLEKDHEVSKNASLMWQRLS